MLFHTEVTSPYPSTMTAGSDGDTTRLLIADASTALRIGLRMIFGLDSTIEIAAEASSADELQQLAFETQPHVVVFDADMQGIDTAIRFIIRALPKCQLIALTMQTSSQFQSHILGIGATACIEKRASPLELLDAVQSARTALGR
jgi:DNA-binding NarL/FixJ family response regulator